MSLEERRKQKLIKKEGEALTLSVSGSTGAAIDHNYRREDGTPHYLREEVGRSGRHGGKELSYRCVKEGRQTTLNKGGDKALMTGRGGKRTREE